MLDPTRMVLCGASGQTFLVHGGCPPASITQKRPNHGQVSGHGEPKSGHTYPNDPVLGVVAVPSCSAPDDPVWGARAAGFPQVIQARGWWLLQLYPPPMLQSGASGLIFLDDPVLRLVVPPACSVPDGPVWGVGSHFPRSSSPGGGGCSACSDLDDPVRGAMAPPA